MRWRFWRRDESDDSGSTSEQWLWSHRHEVNRTAEAMRRALVSELQRSEQIGGRMHTMIDVITGNASTLLNRYLADADPSRIRIDCDGGSHSVIAGQSCEIVVRSDTDANALGALPVYLSNLRAGQRIRIEVLPPKEGE